MDKISILTQLIALYKQLLAAVQPAPASAPVVAPVVVAAPVVDPTSNAQKLVAAAKASLGKPMWKGTGVDPEYACAISVNAVHYLAFGYYIGGEASTQQMYLMLLKSPYFKLTTVYAPGCIIISPTGYGKDPKDYPNGHVGIVCNFGICANNSADGLWSEIYKDQAAWIAQFGTIEDYPTFLFQRI